MEPRLEELRPSPGERRPNHGWRLARAAFWTLREQRSLLALTFLIALLSGADAVLSIWVGVAKPFAGGHEWLGRLVVVAVGTTLVTYLLVAVASAVDAAVTGIELETREALAEAGECTGPIVGWVAIELAFVLACWLVGRAIGAPWIPFPASLLGLFATLFVVPMLAVERVGPGAAIGESLALIRDRWRQALGGLIGIAFFSFLGSWIGWALLAHAAASHREGHPKQFGLTIAGLVVIAIVYSVARVTGEAFATLLLRDGFDDLPGNPPSSVRRSRQARLLRGTAIVLLVFAFAGGITAWDNSARRTLRVSGAPGSNYSLTIDDPQAVTIDGGAPVMYGDREIGTVLGSQLEDEKLRVSFHVEPGVGPAATPSVGQVGEGIVSGPFLELLPTTAGDSEARPA